VVELLVAVVLLAIGIVGLSATVGVVAWHLSAARLETRVNARAQAEMERMLRSGYAQADSGGYGDGELRLAWEVTGGDPKQIVVVAAQRLGPLQLADTLATLIRDR
jgi:Tfp pilus assembly protein PilV